VWGALAARPEQLEAILPSGAAGAHSGVPGRPGVRTRGRSLRRDEIATLGGVEVTSLRRTAIDLLCAREAGVTDEELLSLVERAGARLDTLRHDLSSRRRLRGRRRGLARLQLLVTR
jgi:hypothetical protein